MPSANKTPNYGLNQWQGNEYPKRQDFVDDNSAIDAALKENADGIAAHKADKNNPHGVTAAQAGAVPTSRKVNGHALSNDVTVTKSDVGLGNADNTADEDKPVSTAVQTALNGKVPTTRKVNGHALSADVAVTKSDVGLGNVDNTSDANKPVSTATQAAISAILDSKGQPNGIAALDANKQLVQDAKTLNGHGTDNGPNSVLLSGRKEGTTIGKHSTAEGFQTEASGYSSHAEGYGTTASGSSSHAEGGSTTASGYDSHAEGSSTTASGYDSHAEGLSTTASGYDSHAEGLSTKASGDSSHAEGYGTTANVSASHAQGRYNKALAGDPSVYSTAADAMVIGNGSSDALSNCFRITFNGNVYGLAGFHSSGADYSEFFEWTDENPNVEDRVGHFVTLDGEKIRYANDGDYIVGITSGNPAVIGDHPSESWKERYLRDVFGRLQYEDVAIPAHDEKDKSGKVIRTIPEHTETHFKVNPDYDPAKEAEYANREKRPEWATVGMLGKLVCIDDGTCEVNGYCKPKNGTATKSDTGYRVLARLDETHIKVLMK